MIDIRKLQTAVGATVDGVFGPKSRAAVLAAFTNRNAPAVTPAEIATFADRLGCTEKQLRAVALVESSGGGFDPQGRPKILYERHLFHRLTEGRWSPAPFSQSAGGGYRESSWAKLLAACAHDPDAAFGAGSWGKFQVLGLHWSRLGYESSFALARSTVDSEAAHYELLLRYIFANGLADAMRAISIDPETCRAFAKGYNGPAYAKLGYHQKLARAMR